MNNPYSQYAPTKQDKSRLIKEHLPMIEIVVERMVPHVPSFLSRDDMTSAAMVGLMDAVNRFDESKGILFKTFAEHRIRGAIFDEVRKMDWFSRTLREKHSRITKTLSSLESRFGRTPDENEMAKAMNIGLEEYRQMLNEVCHLGCVSLHETLSSDGTGQTFLENLVNNNDRTTLDKIEASELASEVATYLKQLSEKERLVISLYYYEELSQKEIAEVLEVSEGRVSQLHSQALLKLKVKLQRQRGTPL